LELPPTEVSTHPPGEVQGEGVGGLSRPPLKLLRCPTAGPNKFGEKNGPLFSGHPDLDQSQPSTTEGDGGSPFHPPAAPPPGSFLPPPYPPQAVRSRGWDGAPPVPGAPPGALANLVFYGLDLLCNGGRVQSPDETVPGSAVGRRHAIPSTMPSKNMCSVKFER